MDVSRQDAAWTSATIGSVSDRELQEELVVAAMAPGRRRLDRYRLLLEERTRRLLEGTMTIYGEASEC